jgi:hypothetical protein
VIIIDCLLELLTTSPEREKGALAFYIALLVLVFVIVYLREFASEKKRALMDQR